MAKRIRGLRLPSTPRLPGHPSGLHRQDDGAGLAAPAVPVPRFVDALTRLWAQACRLAESEAKQVFRPDVLSKTHTDCPTVETLWESHEMPLK